MRANTPLARWNALRNIGPFLAMVWQASPRLTVLSVILRLVRAILPVTQLWIGKLIIDEVVRLLSLENQPEAFLQWWQSGQLDWLIVCVGAEFVIALLSDLLGRIVSFADTLLSERLTIRSSVRLMAHAATLDLEAFEDAEFQDKLDRARRQAGGRMTLMGQLFGQMQDLVSVSTLATGLLVYNPWLILVLAIALVPSFLGEAHFNAKNYSLDFQRTPERRELDYVRRTAASVETAKEVKMFGLNDFLIDRYRSLSETFFAANREIARKRSLWGTVFAAVGTAGYYFAYLWMIARTLTGVLTIGDLTFLAGSFRRLRTLLENLLTSFSSTAAQALYLDDLFDFFREEAKIDSPPDAIAIPMPLKEGIVFEDVGFRYPGSEAWAVRNLNFTLNANETVALVGENGAGKTTIVKLLARLYDPQEGRIRLDGCDLREYDIDALRSAIGIIFQDFVRYNFTAGDNIAVGRIDARDDHERIVQSALRSSADRVINKLPDRYDQMIGKRFKNGVELSGGEWQKIAIARAYMRDAQILVLDEPTAALDARSEFEVFQRFRELSKDTTTVLISHRFSSVRMADRILVLSNGRVEASGSHEELLAQPGRYAELFELQAAGYR